MACFVSVRIPQNPVISILLHISGPVDYESLFERMYEILPEDVSSKSRLCDQWLVTRVSSDRLLMYLMIVRIHTFTTAHYHV
ncbi:hypothetical protein PMIT1303_01010 [Prochlorococcus sp. MIT 1303]|nr:hypothetical protein PMIT1303_01010 [Prochlorococcus sp. MIT 1303]